MDLASCAPLGRAVAFPVLVTAGRSASAVEGRRGRGWVIQMEEVTVDRSRSYRTLPIAAAALALVALAPASAWAHTGIGATSGFGNGFAHPLLGWDHLLAMLAVGIWGAQRGGKAVWALPVTFVAIMALGGILALAGMPLPGVEVGILASVLILGAMIAFATRYTLATGVVLVAAFALFHGHAHGTEMPQAATAIGYALGFCTATALLHAAGIAIPLALRRLSTERQPAWTRYAGAGITLAGVILLLA